MSEHRMQLIQMERQLVMGTESQTMDIKPVRQGEAGKRVGRSSDDLSSVVLVEKDGYFHHRHRCGRLRLLAGYEGPGRVRGGRMRAESFRWLWQVSRLRDSRYDD